MSEAKPKGQKSGPKVGPNGPRVHLWGHGPRVDPATKLELELWRDFYGVPFGRAIDALLQHARNNPSFRIPARGRKTYRQLGKSEQIPHMGSKNMDSKDSKDSKDMDSKNMDSKESPQNGLSGPTHTDTPETPQNA